MLAMGPRPSALLIVAIVLGWLGLEAFFGPDHRERVNLALGNREIGILSADETVQFRKELQWLGRIANISGDIALNEPLGDGRLHVFVVDSAAQPQTIRVTGCKRGNAIYDAELKAVFIDVSLLRVDEFNSIFEASGVGSVMSLDVPFHHLFRHFVMLHEFGHHVLH